MEGKFNDALFQEFFGQSDELLEELHRNPRVTYLDIHLLQRKCILFSSNY